jgi:hypothetical protein
VREAMKSSGATSSEDEKLFEFDIEHACSLRMTCTFYPGIKCAARSP